MDLPGGTVAKNLPSSGGDSAPVQEIPHAVEQPAHVPQLLKPMPRAHHPKPAQRDAYMPLLESSPCSLQLEKACAN